MPDVAVMLGEVAHGYFLCFSTTAVAVIVVVVVVIVVVSTTAVVSHLFRQRLMLIKQLGDSHC